MSSDKGYEQHVTDLHDLVIPNADGPTKPLQDYSTSFNGVSIDVHFRDLDMKLIKLIDEADIVVGSVAWLTHVNILKALSRKHSVHIVVQKEDFLRPDRPNTSSNSSWKQSLHALYNALPHPITRYNPSLNNTVLSFMSYAGDPTLAAVRCVGNFNRSNAAASPRAHNKFIVLCKKTGPAQEEQDPQDILFKPYAVWTGSFNFSTNATKSFENAVVIHDSSVADAFFKEWAQIAALSEPLNWQTDWVAPEYRIGS